MDDWKQKAKDADFSRYPKMSKVGSQTFKFLNEGKQVSGEDTGFKGNSVVFTVESEGTTKELWMSALAPVLRDLLKHSESLTGHTTTIKFTGSGLNTRAEVTAWK